MEARRKIVYEFEHADSLARLEPKITQRTLDGWKAAGQPREMAVQTDEARFGFQYVQTFYRYSDESISREPWIFARR